MDEDIKKQVEEFVKRFKLVMNPADEIREDYHEDYDFVLLFDGKKVMDGKFGCGPLCKDIHGVRVLECIFDDASCYAGIMTGGDELDEFGEFMSELGYEVKDMKKAMKAFKGCKDTYYKVAGVVLSNTAWLDGVDGSSADDYLRDVCEYLDSDEVDKGLVDIDWDSYVEDYK